MPKSFSKAGAQGRAFSSDKERARSLQLLRSFSAQGSFGFVKLILTGVVLLMETCPRSWCGAFTKPKSSGSTFPQRGEGVKNPEVEFIQHHGNFVT